MKYTFMLCLLILGNTIPAFSQNDTTYLYFNKGWQPCNKDTAYYYGKVYKSNNLWVRKDFWVKGNQVQMETSYLDSAYKNPYGVFNWYYENGALNHNIVYENGKSKTADYFYESGKKKAHVTYTANGSVQTGWDENGKEIPNYLAEKEAVFPGGIEGWKTYLEKNLDANVAANSRAKPGNYTVKVQFIVDKEGNISNVHAIEVPAACKRCEKEAVRIIKNGPKWEPAVQDNKYVIYQAIQFITWQVVKE